MNKTPVVGQSIGKLCSEEDIARDKNGYTHPNLHRRIDPKPVQHPEVKPREYSINISNNNSIRTTKIHTYDDNNLDEIP